MNAELAKLIIRNLLANAIKHNVEGGYVKISLEKTSLTIKNTGRVPGGEPKTYFERFRKDQNSSSSLGLELSIVKAITKANDFDLRYTIKKDIHIVRLTFAAP